MADQLPELARLVAIMARLRDPAGGCPWDLEQTFASLVRHTIEEAYEVAEAAEAADAEALCDELGDLLFQTVFYSRIAEEQGLFDLDTVAAGICDKLVRRHPHVFADQPVADVAEQNRAWERHKAAERRARAADGRPPGTLDGVSTRLPALTRSVKLSRRAASVGFDWTDHRGVLAKVDEELAELRDELDRDPQRPAVAHELGDLLFSCANLARKLELDPETLLRDANRRFESRFGFIEDRLRQQGHRVDEVQADLLEQLWQQAKRAD